MLTTYKYEEIAPEAEGLIVPVTASELEALKEGQPFIQPAIDKQLQQMLSSGILKAKTGNTAAVATLGLLPQQMVVITVIDEAATELREAFAQAAGKVKSNKLNTLAIDISSAAVSRVLQQAGIERAVKCMLEGLKLTLIGRQVLKKQEQSLFEVQQISFVLNDEQLGHKSIIEAAVQEAEYMTESVKLARDLTNMSGNELTPERLAFYAEEVAQKLELDIEVLDEWSCAEEQMGGLLGVGQGSVNPPRMIVIHYEGNPESEEKWGIVGKGITFDTGGISLKPAAGMEDMISDMGGAAAVLGAIHAIASMKVKANVLAVIPTAENMPSDRALKPGDVIRTMSGHTVEVVNTDAEGRLVLADGITTAIKRGATKLVDVATLTGAVLVALGTEATGAVTNDKSLMEKVIAASEKSGERIWQLPAYAEYKKLIESDVADLKNSGGRHAGSITAGLFIGHFVEEKPWVHLDIAGTAYVNKARRWEPKGATGVMVRTLYELIAEKDR
ncbi:leucyl aminopeptidase [Paenibacillus camelliae]|uniref:leucyl aminopeptidase n=1 Tax=Paenibacillus camelliae TaxID=512410 RepID=UPI00203EBFAF|nr:leucyl aminopeptidase [Paenibacillus camelliae]MCM3632573.1 leucyl aminopeptidase [Paenibacillus camelliae]